MKKKLNQRFSDLRVSNYFQPLLLLALLLLLIIFLTISTDAFFTLKNWINIFNNHMVHQLLLAVGMTFVITSGGLDLSIGANLGLSGIFMALMLKAGLPVPLTILCGLLSAAALGAFNGLLVANFMINPLIITLGTSSVLSGLGLIITGGTPIYQMPADFARIAKFSVLGLPFPIIVSAVVLFAAAVLLNRTRWGQYTLTMGSNEKTLARVGVNVRRHKVSVYALCGLIAGIASIIITARMNVAEATAGAGMEMDAIAAVVMGGTLLSGGKSTMLGTSIACLLLSVMKNGLTMLSVNAHYQSFIIGLILLLAVIVTDLQQRNFRRTKS